MSPEIALPEEIWRIIFCEKKPNLVLWQLCALFSGILSDIFSNCLEKSLRNLLPYLTLNDLLKLRCVSGRLKEKVGYVLDWSMFGHDDTEDSSEYEDEDWRRRFFPFLKLNHGRIGDISRLLSFMNDNSMKGNLFVGRCVSISLELDNREDEMNVFMEYLRRFGKHIEVLRIRAASNFPGDILRYFLACVSLTEKVKNVELLPIIATKNWSAANREMAVYSYSRSRGVHLTFLQSIVISPSISYNEEGYNFTNTNRPYFDGEYFLSILSELKNLKRILVSQYDCYRLFEEHGNEFPFLTELELCFHTGMIYRINLTFERLRRLTLRFFHPEESLNICEALSVEDSRITNLHIIINFLGTKTQNPVFLSFKEPLPLKKLTTLKLTGAVPSHDIQGLHSMSSLTKIDMTVMKNVNNFDYLWAKIPSLTSYSVKTSDLKRERKNRR